MKTSNFKHNFIDFSKLVQQRELLDGQLNENKSVLEELNLLKDDNQVGFYCRKKIDFYEKKSFWNFSSFQLYQKMYQQTKFSQARLN